MKSNRSFQRFFDVPQEKEYKYNILVYPNITFPDNLEKDSYVVVMRNVLDVLNKMRDDLFFVFITPQFVKSLDRPNTEQLIYPLPTFPNAMRTHFDYFSLYKLIDWRERDIDIVYSHLPEHTLQLVNLIYNSTNLSPRIIGYCHWFELPENVGFQKRFFDLNLLGILEMEECGVNTEWLRNLVLDRAKETFNQNYIEILKHTIKPHYLGVDMIDLKPAKLRPKSVLFNHRDGEYTGLNWFISCMDKLWERRKDFKVYMTLANRNRPYIEKVSIADRQEYMDFVKSMRIGVGCFKNYSAWSISTTDGLSMGVPYILPNDLCYPEMIGGDYPLLYNNEKQFLKLVDRLLDDDDIRNDIVKAIKPKIEKMTWEERVKEWFNGWMIFEDGLQPMIGKTEAYDRIVSYIHKHGYVSKKNLMEYLNWSMRIDFTRYRNRLRTEKSIMLTKDGYQKR